MVPQIEASSSFTIIPSDHANPQQHQQKPFLMDF